MTPKATSHVIQGMQKDTSKSKLSKEFAFDAKNIRITAREDNTLLTITNEKGNKQLKSILGYYLGHCVLNNQLILFTTVIGELDIIYLYDSDFNQTILYKGNLNFNLDNPLETLGVYENEDIQKVYWVDGRNQPRVINIKASEDIRNKWSDYSFDFIPELALQESVSVEAISNSSLFAPGVIQYAFSYYNKYGQESNIFDVTPLCYLTHKNRGASPEETIKDLAFKVKVTNLDTKFDYIRIYSIHRTSLNATPTVKRIIDLPISIPEETTEIKESVSSYNIANNYTIGYYSTDFKYDSLPLDNIKEYETTNGNIIETTYSFAKSSIEVDPNNQYLILYDENAVEKERIKVIGITFYIRTEEVILPGSNKKIIKRILTAKDTNTTFIITKIQYNNTIPSIEYIDNGTLGETIDPTQLLYIGGEDIIAGTITNKDNTLFLGNIVLNKLSIPENIKASIKNTTITPQRRYIKLKEDKNLMYASDYTLINEDSYYKAGEHYRVGIQFQHKSGKWSEPLFIKDYTIALNQRPSINNTTLSVPSFSCNISDNIIENLINLGYKKMRGLVVFPDKHERKILAQGILCPTVYNVNNRTRNNPYAQSSWFLRPNMPFQMEEDYSPNTTGEEADKGSIIEFRHGRLLYYGGDKGAEIQNAVEYGVDQSILNFYSPDIQEIGGFIKREDIQFKIVGLVNFTSNYGDIDIITKTPTIAYNAKGFIHLKTSNLQSGGTGLISGLYYQDGNVDDTVPTDNRYYLIYPWHRSGSLNNDSSSKASYNKRTQSAILEKKKISNIKFSEFNTWLPMSEMWDSFGGTSIISLANGISNIELFNSDQISLSKIKSNITNNDYNYYGNIDELVTNDYYKYGIFYGNTFNQSTLNSNSNDLHSDPIRIKYKTTPHLVFKLNNSHYGHEIVLPNIETTLEDGSTFCINSVNGNTVTSGESLTSQFIGPQITFAFVEPVDPKENDLQMIRSTVGNLSVIKVLIYKAGDWVDYEKGSVPNKSKVVHVKTSEDKVDIYYFNGKWTIGKDNAFVWEKGDTVNIMPSIEGTEISVVQETIKPDFTVKYPYLYLADFYIKPDAVEGAFGGNTEDALKNNQWLAASDSIPLTSSLLTYKYGDTRYQRYDCLKTYAFTPEDENQVIEIASFMCETRVNLLGRYDKNIGNLSNLNADPTNFNLFNPVYSQKDNFFNYRILDSDIYKLDKFTNTITWSKEKFAGEDVDTWTNITMASTLDLDGTKGKVNKLITFKDQIFAFQDKGISNILFNSRVQIPVSDGVPVEISNGMKVDGSRYISDNIGCQNKNSIVTTPSGVYFLDSESNGIYLLADGLTNLSTNKGFDIWTKEVSKDSSFKSFYDKNEKDIYFTTKDYCLGYSEKLGQFTSFYAYNDVETMFNIGTGFYSIKADNEGDQSIYQHSIGNYNEFYGEIKPYHLTIISNEDPQVDKLFTNLDYRADFFDSNNNYLENESFDTLEVWNEYQRGKETLKYSKFRPSNLKKRFRMWGADIPRDKKNKLDRMRNPWLYIKLSKEKPGTSKMELHDLVVKYLE